MDKLILSSTRTVILFGRNLLGSINAPYVTYRKLSGENVKLHQTFVIIFIVVMYFLFVSTLRMGVHNPFLLTVKFNSLLAASTAGFVGMIILFYFLGKLTGGSGTLRKIYILWSFSLMPTLVWFFTTSFLYIILPPPRTISLLGKLYSGVFIAFSLSVFLWKIVLYYLTLRFSLRLDLWKIAQVSAVVIPAVIIYSLIMYRLGIFRIPFL